MMKKIVIIGASGYLGNYVYESLKKRNRKEEEIIGTFYKNTFMDNDLQQLDVTNKATLITFLAHSKPDTIVFFSGVKNVGWCEQNPINAKAINTEPLNTCVNFLKRHNKNAQLIFISSDYVFDGSKGNYREEDKRLPTTIYGLTKKKAEDIVFRSTIPHKIIRTSAVMGAGSVFCDWLYESFKQGSPIEMFDDVFFTPTPIVFFSDVLTYIIDNFDKIERSIIHLVGDQRMSRYAFGKLFAKITGFGDQHIVPTHSNQMLLPMDLSLKQSLLCREEQRLSFDEYLKRSLASYISKK